MIESRCFWRGQNGICISNRLVDGGLARSPDLVYNRLKDFINKT